MIADGIVTDYTYDNANRLLQAGEDTFNYDPNGNLIEKTTKDGTVTYDYTADNYLKEVFYPDDTGVEYTYDAFRRKTSRTEIYYDLKNLEKVQAQIQQNNNNSNSNNSNNGNDKEKTNNGNASNDKITGKENAITRGNGEKTGLLK